MVLKFALNTIPADALIKKATLSVYPYNNFLEGKNGPKSVYRITKTWTEAQVTWNSPWSTKGGDFSAQALATSSNTSLNVWEDYDVASAIKDMAENNGDNFGFIFKFNSMSGNGVMFNSHLSNTVDKRPKLTITYEPATIITPDKKFKVSVLSEYDFSVFNMQGREIASYTIRSPGQLENVKQKLPSGVYLFGIKHADKLVEKKLWFKK